MKKRNEWWLKGRIGSLLEGLPEEGSGPFYITGRYNHVRGAKGQGYVGLCLRGNSKQRRQQRRAVLRYLNGS